MIRKFEKSSDRTVILRHDKDLLDYFLYIGICIIFHLSILSATLFMLFLLLKCKIILLIIL